MISGSDPLAQLAPGETPAMPELTGFLHLIDVFHAREAARADVAGVVLHGRLDGRAELGILADEFGRALFRCSRERSQNGKDVICDTFTSFTDIGRRPYILESPRQTWSGQGMAEPDIEIDPPGEMLELLAFVRDYWLAKRGTYEIPRRADIVPSQLKPYLPNVLLADVVDGGRDFRYRLVGSHLHRSFAGNPTGKLMSEALMPFGPETVRITIDVYASVVRKRLPVTIRAAGSYYAQDFKTVDALLAPLSDNGRDVNMVFGAFEFAWNKDVAVAMTRSGQTEEQDMQRALAAHG
jgi:hypothetical protein